jgi:phospholipid/cholesterol/gamma-HCH transport system substrate-binding protein
MDKRKRNLAAVGLLTLVASVIFVWGLFWLMGTPLLQGGMDVHVLLDDGGGLKRSDRVHLQGVQIGIVTNVRLRPEGGVVAKLRLDEGLALPTDTRAVIRGDVFGAHSVDLVPGQALLRVGAGDTIRGGTTPQLTQLASDLSARVESVLVNADALLSPSAVSDVHATAAVLPETAQELRAAFAELRLASASLRRTAERVEGSETGATLNSAIGEIERTATALTAAAGRMEQSMGSFASVLDKIDNGNGNLGRLVNDTTIYVELNQTLREVRALATDIRERPSRYFTIRVF